MHPTHHRASPKPPESTTRLPSTLAVVDDDQAFSRFLCQALSANGIQTRWFPDSESLLCFERPFDFDFYVLDLSLPGIDGLSLLRLLRKRSSAGVLVASGQLGNELSDQVIHAGADMHLCKPVSLDQVRLAIAGVYRRSCEAQASSAAWRLDEARRVLLAPGGARIELSPTDLSVLGCLLEAGGDPVSRDTLTGRIGHDTETHPNRLNATIYRLRRRIERATEQLAPLQTKSRTGYLFRAPLVRL